MYDPRLHMERKQVMAVPARVATRVPSTRAAPTAATVGPYRSSWHLAAMPPACHVSQLMHLNYKGNLQGVPKHISLRSIAVV